jgi:transcriptional regulator with XRE-family HTH domain
VTRPQEIWLIEGFDMAKQYKSVEELINDLSEDDAFKRKVSAKLAANKLSKLLSAIRCKNNLTQKQLAEKIGCWQGTISKIESSDDDDLSIKDLRNYAKALGLGLAISFPEKKTVRYTDRVKFHALQMQRYLQMIADTAKGDAAIVAGAEDFHVEALYNVNKLILESMAKIEKTKVNKIDRTQSSDILITGSVSAEMAGV